ncbi:2912_t:CDS:1 [Funneliformis mosseae]|uniref:2912_t:CDS:1 n=1 Tax=Funneliformis mosseae TaxID=27381 RepID=A0A9N9CUI5_FUNMO|nr:2912_t:CDS:1 [Funneliformis mosseae]
MPKIRKPTNNNRIIKSDIDSKLNFGNDGFNYILKPTIPSTLTINEIVSVIKAPNNNKKAKTFPNAFIAYKKALIKENRNRNIKLPPMRHLSKITSCYWDEEPENVKEFYKKLSEKAKSLYKLENPIQILFDKHMDEVEKVSRVTGVNNKADSNYIQDIEDPVENIIYTQNSTSDLPIEDNSASVMNFLLENNYINSSQANFVNNNFFEDPYIMNQVHNDQVYISDYVNFTQGIDDLTFTHSYLPTEDYSSCNLFDREYEMEHIFTDFALVENNQESVSTYGTDSDYKL